MKKTKQSNELNLTWEEIGLISQGLAQSARPLRAATQDITDEYSLGPRGAWIVRLIDHGSVFPQDLTNVFCIGRSLMTAELNRLTRAKLVSYTKCAEDGRRVELTLTPLGEQVNKRVKQVLSKLITQRFAAYSREEVLLCSRMLQDFINPNLDSDKTTRANHVVTNNSSARVVKSSKPRVRKA